MHTPTRAAREPQTFIFLSGDAQPLGAVPLDRRFYAITSPLEVAGELEYRSWMRALQQQHTPNANTVLAKHLRWALERLQLTAQADTPEWRAAHAAVTAPQPGALREHLRWALRAIERSALGMGLYFEAAAADLDTVDRLHSYITACDAYRRAGRAD